MFLPIALLLIAPLFPESLDLHRIPPPLNHLLPIEVLEGLSASGMELAR